MKFRFQLLFFILICSGMAPSFAVAPYGSMMLPIQFTIENGDFVNSTLDVRKNGEEILNKLGEKNMHLRLEYGNQYLLSFSKPGYITKKIEVNTNVPTEHGKQGFEPYKIGVILYKQYEGINIVVYNQPVALIKFQASIDAFDYDTDYTKSILSLLTDTENKLAARAAEERILLKAAAYKPKPIFDSSKDPVKNSSSEKESKSVITESNPAVPPPTHSTGSGSSGKESSTPDLSAENKPPQGNSSTGEDHYNQQNPTSGTDFPPVNSSHAAADKPPGKIFIQENQDTVHFSDSKNINELPIVHFKREKNNNSDTTGPVTGGEDRNHSGSDLTNGNEVTKTTLNHKSGKDFSVSPIEQSNVISKTIETKSESNRVITTVRITNGDHVTEYSHVVYNWGGEYFFINKTEPISFHLFNLYTGQ